MKSLAAIVVLLIAWATNAQAAEDAGGAIGDFKRWCISQPLEFNAFSATMRKQGFKMAFDRKSPLWQGRQVESLVWEATDGSKGGYGIAVTTGSVNGKTIPMSCAVVISGTLDPVLSLMKNDRRFGTPKAKRDIPNVRSFIWDGTEPKSEIQLIEINAGTPAAQTMIKFNPFFSAS
jgi:hypothetical protein